MSMWMDNPNKYGPAAGPIFQQLYQQPGIFAKALSDNYGSYAGGLGSTGKSYADTFGAYSAGLGSMATARANEASARYGANAMAEAARQGALANLGSSALGAYGSASNSALNAWAANQQAYNRAAADMHTANQQSLGTVGASANSALGALGGAYAGIGRGQMASDALANMNFSMGGGGGGGFSAAGPSGPIAGGSYGSAPGGFGFSGSASSSGGAGSSQAYAGLEALRNSIVNSGAMGSINAGAAAGRQQLDSQHSSSRNMPSEMLGQTLSGLMTLGGPAYSNINRGMDQFYANTQMSERPYESMLASLNGGFGAAGNQIGSVQRDLGRGFGAANAGVNNMWTQSLGKSPEFQTPAEREIAAREGRMERQRSQDMARLSRLERMAAAGPFQSYYQRQADMQRQRMGV